MMGRWDDQNEGQGLYAGSWGPASRLCLACLYLACRAALKKAVFPTDSFGPSWVFLSLLGFCFWNYFRPPLNPPASCPSPKHTVFQHKTYFSVNTSWPHSQDILINNFRPSAFCLFMFVHKLVQTCTGSEFSPRQRASCVAFWQTEMLLSLASHSSAFGIWILWTNQSNLWLVLPFALSKWTSYTSRVEYIINESVSECWHLLGQKLPIWGVQYYQPSSPDWKKNSRLGFWLIKGPFPGIQETLI